MKEKKSFYKKLLIWRYKHISDQNFIYVLSIVVGLLAGLGSVIIKNLTYLIGLLFKNNYTENYLNHFYFITPIIGFFLVYLLLKYVIKNNTGRNVMIDAPASLDEAQLKELHLALNLK